MSNRLPLNVSVRRLQEDTYPEKFVVSPMPSGATFSLEVEGLTPVAGVVTGDDVEFAISGTIANATPGKYDWQIVMTASGWTRTIIEGTWTIAARAVT